MASTEREREEKRVESHLATLVSVRSIRMSRKTTGCKYCDDQDGEKKPNMERGTLGASETRIQGVRNACAPQWPAYEEGKVKNLAFFFQISGEFAQFFLRRLRDHCCERMHFSFEGRRFQSFTFPVSRKLTASIEERRMFALLLGEMQTVTFSVWSFWLIRFL